MPAPHQDERPTSVPMEGDEHQLEEDDEGWAGHQEEVDYTKEVIFEDSSDEDSPKKGRNKEQKEVVENHTHLILIVSIFACIFLS